MPQEEKKETGQVEEISRRQFIKGAGVMIGGAAVASLAIVSGCGSAESSPTSSTTTNTTTTTTKTTTSTTNSPTNNTTTNTTTSTGTTTSASFLYVPATKNPPLEDTVGCTTKVAKDRIYSLEHTWVLSLTEKLVVVGISDKFQLLTGMVERGELYIMPIGTKLDRGDFLANLEGQKMNVDVTSPVSGTIVQVNDDLYIHSDWLTAEPYLTGYLVVIELSKPEELKDLIDAVTYAKLQANKT
jgi:glycine cleavage system H protein